MEVKERKKVESCKSIETKQQLRWESHKVFETDAPKPGTDQWKQVCFQYCYSLCYISTYYFSQNTLPAFRIHI